MVFDIGALNYVPTLAIRASEMNGLEELPGLTKDRMQPTFLLAPWANSIGLSKSIDRIQKAFPHRSYFLDLDRDYRPSDGEAQSQIELQDLFSNADCFKNWTDFISQYENVHPCLQHDSQTTEQLLTQIERIQSSEKRFCVRIELKRKPDNLTNIVEALNQLGTADYVISIDGGWTQDFQTTEATILGLISGAFADIDATIPIIVSCTSIPKEFTDIKGRKTVNFENRNIFQNLIRNTNRATLVYGDWGSTRPREYGFGRKPKPRIDYPTSRSWICARNKEEEWDFQDAASEIVRSPEWQASSGLGIWGEQMIKQTSLNPAIGINTPQKNVASRVNIHLHRQAFYDERDLKKLDLDEDWED